MQNWKNHFSITRAAAEARILLLLLIFVALSPPSSTAVAFGEASSLSSWIQLNEASTATSSPSFDSSKTSKFKSESKFLSQDSFAAAAHSLTKFFHNEKYACASCQFASLLLNARNISSLSTTKAICSTLPGCQQEWQHCEIVRNLPEDQFYENFNNPHFNWIVTTALEMHQNCQRDGTINLAAIAPTTSKCVECLLVYDLVKFFDENVIGVQTERAILMILADFCNGLGGSLMMTFCMDAQQILNAVFQGLRDSMGGLYELFGTDLLGCPKLPQFLCNCLGNCALS